MRKIFDPQMKIGEIAIEHIKFDLRSRDEIPKLLMGLQSIYCNNLRTPDVEKKLKKIKSLIISNNFDTNYFLNLWSDLENYLGSEDLNLKLLNVEMSMRKKNAKNN